MRVVDGAAYSGCALRRPEAICSSPLYHVKLQRSAVLHHLLLCCNMLCSSQPLVLCGVATCDAVLQRVAGCAFPMKATVSEPLPIITVDVGKGIVLRCQPPSHHISTGTALIPPASAPELPGLTPPTSASGLGSPRPQLHRD